MVGAAKAIIKGAARRDIARSNIVIAILEPQPRHRTKK
jgi:hypothetical protein